METRKSLSGRRNKGFSEVFVSLIAIFGLINIVSGINFDIAPGKEECFFEEVHQDTQIKGAYAVTEGSHRDIDVQIYNPRGKVVYNVKRDGEGKFMLKAESDGTYKFCFSNKVRHRLSYFRRQSCSSWRLGNELIL